MKSLFNSRSLAAAAIVCAAHAAGAATLYDPGLKTLPSAQGWTTSAMFGPFSESAVSGRYEFETLSADVTRAGSALVNLPALDTSAGFTLGFTLRVVSESHLNDNRAGFSFIVTGLDPAHALEVAFWSNHVWAYTGSFTHGADKPFDTTATHDYSLAVKNNTYVFTGDGTPLLSGALIDLAAGGPVYTQAGLLFFGDDTSSARSQIELGRVSLSPVPEPGTVPLLAAGLIGLAWWRRRAH